MSTELEAGYEKGRAAWPEISVPQDEFVHVFDEVIDRAVGDADFPRQFPALQSGQTARGNALFRRPDQVFPKFGSSFQCFRHSLPFLERCSNIS